MLVTKRDIEYTPRGYSQTFTIPKGTRTTHQTAMGYDENYNFIDDLSWIPKECHTLRHDMTYYGYNVPKELLEEVN